MKYMMVVVWMLSACSGTAPECQEIVEAYAQRRQDELDMALLRAASREEAMANARALAKQYLGNIAADFEVDCAPYDGELFDGWRCVYHQTVLDRCVDEERRYQLIVDSTRST